MTCGSRFLLWATYEFILLPLSSIQWQKNKSVLAHLQESNMGSFNRESSLLLLDAVLTLHYPKYVLVFHNLFGAANFNLFLAVGIWSIWNSQFFLLLMWHCHSRFMFYWSRCGLSNKKYIDVIGNKTPYFSCLSI